MFPKLATMRKKMYNMKHGVYIKREKRREMRERNISLRD